MSISAPKYLFKRFFIFVEVLFVFLALQKLTFNGDIRVLIGIHPIQHGLLLIFTVYVIFLQIIIDFNLNILVRSRSLFNKNHVITLIKSYHIFAFIYLSCYFGLLLFMSISVISFSYIKYLIVYFLLILLIYLFFSNMSLITILYFDNVKANFILPIILSIVLSVYLYSTEISRFIYFSVDWQYVNQLLSLAIFLNIVSYFLIGYNVKKEI